MRVCRGLHQLGQSVGAVGQQGGPQITAAVELPCQFESLVQCGDDVDLGGAEFLLGMPVTAIMWWVSAFSAKR